MDLSICIVSMNHIKVLKECIDSIYQNSPKKYSFEIIIVDNCSKDGTQNILKRYLKKNKNLKVIFNTQKRNFAENNNIAIRQSKGKYLLILNPDTIVHENTLDYMIDYLKFNEFVGAATCKLTYEDGSFQDSARRFIKLKYMLASRFKAWGLFNFRNINDEYILAKESDTKPKEVDWILGACMFIKKQVLEEIGLFDERFILYAEDTDLCYRIKQAGWKIMYVPNVSIVHIYKRAAANHIFSKTAFLQLYTTYLFYAKHYWKIIK